MQAKYRLLIALGFICAGIGLFAGAVVLNPIVFVPGVGFPLFSFFLSIFLGAAVSFYFGLVIGGKAISDLINDHEDGAFLPNNKNRHQEKGEFHQDTLGGADKPLAQESHEINVSEKNNLVYEDNKMPGKVHQKSPPQQSGFFNSLCCFFGAAPRDKEVTPNRNNEPDSTSGGVLPGYPN
ncbi:MAG: hypothetical protein Q8M03_14760 [Legionella sp.]|nr:hypothetical protein [Legionella sp.]